GGLARQVRHTVISRESDIDRAGVTGLHPHYLFGEAGNEPLAANFEVDVGPGAALEFGSVDPPDVINGQHLAFGGATVTQLVRRDLDQLTVALGDVGDGLVYRLRRHFGLQAGEADRAEIGRCYIGHQLQLDLEFQVFCGTRPDIRSDEVDFRLKRGPQPTVVEHLAGCLADGLFQHLRGDRGSVAL